MFETIPLADLATLAGALLAASVISGLLAGLFGVGGGAVMVPVLYEVFRAIDVPEEVRMHLAVGTSLAVIIPISLRSFRGHYARGVVDVPSLKLWAIPVVIGTIAGSAVAAYVSSGFLKGVFMVAGAAIALKMLSGKSEWRFSDDLPGPVGMRAYGLGLGVVSAWMGIGGGSFVNLIYAMHNRPVHQGVATASGVGILIAIPGTIGFILAGWPHMAVLPPLSVGYVSMIGFVLLTPISVMVAPLGVRMAHSFSRRHLEMAMGAFLLLVSIRFATDLFL